MKSFIKVLVNVLTISRIIFSLLLIFFIKLSDITFLILIAILLLTDQIDGVLARKFKVQTLFGAIMDSIADKVLCITLLVPLIKLDIGDSTGVLMLFGELLILFINIIATLYGRKTSVSMIGKIKMWILSVSIVIGYTVKFDYIPILLFNISSIITFIVQLVVSFNYIKSLASQKKIKKVSDFKKDIKNLFNTDYYMNVYNS